MTEREIAAEDIQSDYEREHSVCPDCGCHECACDELCAPGALEEGGDEYDPPDLERYGFDGGVFEGAEDALAQRDEPNLPDPALDRLDWDAAEEHEKRTNPR